MHPDIERFKQEQNEFGCIIKQLPVSEQVAAAKTAVEIFRGNAPSVPESVLASPLPTDPQHLAVYTSKYWGSKGIKLGVSFLDGTPSDIRDRILIYMNRWSAYANIVFAWSQSGGEVRISRGQGGYWSYLGTDILHIPKGQITMNLQGITMRTSDAECERVIPHEAGHTCGFPHEHMRPELVNRLDRDKTITYFRQNQGWDANTTMQQVLTPINPALLQATPEADQDSIMCYQLPGSITKDGQPIRGGSRINALDAKMANSLYPKKDGPVVPGPVDPGPVSPPPPNPGEVSVTQSIILAAVNAVFDKLLEQANPFFRPVIEYIRAAVIAAINKRFAASAIAHGLLLGNGLPVDPTRIAQVMLIGAVNGALSALSGELGSIWAPLVESIRAKVLEALTNLFETRGEELAGDVQFQALAYNDYLAVAQASPSMRRHDPYVR